MAALTRRAWLGAATMGTVAVRRELKRLRALVATRAAATPSPTLLALKADPAAVMTRAGLTPDEWQVEVLSSPCSRLLMLASRQSGKSSVSAALATREALTKPAALVLLLSPSLRQSAETFRKVMDNYNALGRPVPQSGPRDSSLRLELANGSRVVALPGTEATIRGFSGASLLVIDEAARVPDEMYRSVRPMLAVSRGRLVALSTPWGKRGWFYEEWISERRWARFSVTAKDCPRISPEFLAEEEAALGDHFFAQEYGIEFREVIDSLFRQSDIEAALTSDLRPLDLGA